MAKVSYASMKLKMIEDIEKITFNGIDIEILKYLPIEEKYNLISITLQKSLENDNVYNSVLMDMYFHLYLVFLYTNISFTDKQKEDEAKLYDILKSNGLLDEIINKIPENEYNMLYSYLEEEASKKMESKRSVASLITSLINDLPSQAQAAMDIVENFDKDKFKNVLEFAEYANGGRPIK